jgi:hypothetical protein
MLSGLSTTWGWVSFSRFYFYTKNFFTIPFRKIYVSLFNPIFMV